MKRRLLLEAVRSVAKFLDELLLSSELSHLLFGVALLVVGVSFEG